MPQHDLILDNGSGAAFRADANSALAALGSTMKGPNAPPTPTAGMMWLDDDTPSTSVWTLKIYDGAEWISIGTFDISANSFAPSISLLRPAAGTAAAPAYSFTGDPDTGIFSGGANLLSVSIGGVRTAEIAQSSFILENRAGDANLAYFGRATDASATNARGVGFIAVNENSVPVASTGYSIATNGSGSIELYATPAGSRASDRRVNRMTIPGSGEISMVGPVNVSSGDLGVAGNLLFNSGYGSAAIAYGVRAWVNFNGTGTVAIRASGGVTSITDNGTGDYTVNLNFTMPDTNYSYHVVASNGGEPLRVGFNATGGSTMEIAPTTTAFRFYVNNSANTAQVDAKYVNVLAVR